MTDPMDPKSGDKIVCSGCRQEIVEGEGTNWCPTECVCLGAVWCQKCLNIHLDRVKGTPEEIQYSEFRGKLEGLINECSMENGSDTPDFILAQFITGCLSTFDKTLARRTEWYTPENGESDEKKSFESALIDSWKPKHAMEMNESGWKLTYNGGSLLWEKQDEYENCLSLNDREAHGLWSRRMKLVDGIRDAGDRRDSSRAAFLEGELAKLPTYEQLAGGE